MRTNVSLEVQYSCPRRNLVEPKQKCWQKSVKLRISQPRGNMEFPISPQNKKCYLKRIFNVTVQYLDDSWRATAAFHIDRVFTIHTSIKGAFSLTSSRFPAATKRIPMKATNICVSNQLRYSLNCNVHRYA